MDAKKSPLKTLSILPSLDAGGAERVMISLMNGMDRKKYDPALLSSRRDGPLKAILDLAIPFYTRDRKPTRLIFPFLFSLTRK